MAKNIKLKNTGDPVPCNVSILILTLQIEKRYGKRVVLIIPVSIGLLRLIGETISKGRCVSGREGITDQSKLKTARMNTSGNKPGY